jgi:hypothetical protein
VKLCFVLNGKKICINIPILVWPWIPPWIRVVGPHPEPWKWLDGPEISEKLQQEILTVGLIDELAKSLSPDKAKRIQAVARELINESELPKGMSISFQA